MEGVNDQIENWSLTMTIHVAQLQIDWLTDQLGMLLFRAVNVYVDCFVGIAIYL